MSSDVLLTALPSLAVGPPCQDNLTYQSLAFPVSNFTVLSVPQIGQTTLLKPTLLLRGSDPILPLLTSPEDPPYPSTRIRSVRALGLLLLYACCKQCFLCVASRPYRSSRLLAVLPTAHPDRVTEESLVFLQSHPQVSCVAPLRFDCQS